MVNYVQEEWTGIRKKLEAAGIKAIDGERAACEKAVGDAKATFDEGRLTEALTSFGEGDAPMAKVRRRI